MERKIGETFEFEGKILQVKEAEQYACKGCFFENKCNKAIVNPVAGNCFFNARTDKKNVVFVEVAQTSDEEPRKQEEHKLNLCEVLKYCPGGTQFWSPLLGDVKFMCVGDRSVTVEDKNTNSWDINEDSTITIGGVHGVTSVEPMLFPSREQRDWSKVKYERPVENLPKTWDEFVMEKGFNPEKFTFNGLYMELSDSMLAGGDDIGRYCDQLIAQVKLHALRDCYRQGWEPEYNEKSYSIMMLKNGTYKVVDFVSTSKFLSFRDRQTAILFLACFEEIIKEAGDLI